MREEWRGWVERWEASGLSGTKFAEQHGLAIRTLYGWRTRLEAEAEAMLVPEPKEAFTEVRIRGIEPSPASGTIEIVARGGRLVRVTGPVDAARLRTVLEAVEEC